ncbi:DUF6046 domain-containing protein [Flavobacterium cerinum]|uniref:DUF6046 domain-containing protein n=1 Tax=Flavobacterium cerinum TaxID=2502784 RepID=A0A444HEI4_9FLAO|nr:DUF6046 domain-containing protein [Flavobacterium cerinum]RWX03361.1 hypothetical protein EPI11_00080 [Flavobacterium cerinum]
MSTYNINMQELFRTAFHFNLYAATDAVGDKLLNDYGTIEVIPTNSPLVAMSKQGMPVWDYVRLLPKKIAGTGENFEGFDFPVETVVEAVLPKKVAETEIFGRDGTVEELMGLGDWQINIKGFIINYDSTDYPEDQVRALKRVCELKDVELAVEGTYLNMLDINYISIRNLNLPPSVGYGNMATFEIECRSKIPFIINRTDGVLL